MDDNTQNPQQAGNQPQVPETPAIPQAPSPAPTPTPLQETPMAPPTLSTPDTPASVPGLEPAKTLEEISGINDQLAEVAKTEPGSLETAPPSRADLYSKITKIAVPIVIAVVLGVGGYFAYAYLFVEETPEPEQTAEEPTETAEESTETSDFLESLEENLEESLQDAENPLEDGFLEESFEEVVDAFNEDLGQFTETSTDEPAEESTEKQKVPRVIQ
jgi:hypothetical protein